VAPLFDLKHLEEIFRHKVFKILLSKEKITEGLFDIPMNPSRKTSPYQTKKTSDFFVFFLTIQGIFL